MRTVCSLAVAVLALSAAMAGWAQSPPAPRDFKPARTAVVDISAVFESYQKKKDIEMKLDLEIKAEEKKLQKMESDAKAIVEELKNLEEGSDKHRELTLKRTDLEYQFKAKQKQLLRDFQEKQFNALKEIRNEITSDVERYAASMEIDLVLEKKVSAEGQGKAQAVHWPIVHYVKPELEITEDIVKRLNAQYGKPPTGGAGK